MEHYFKNFGIQLTDKQNAAQTTTLLIVKNPDGSPRWVCNSKATKPLFLKFYTVNSTRSKLLARLIKGVFFLSLQKVIFKTEKVFFKSIPDGSESIIDITSNNWALFTGTVGPNNKVLIYKEDANNSQFYKVVDSSKTIALIENEEAKLNQLSLMKLGHFILPKAERVSYNILKLHDISNQAYRSNEFTEYHRNALTELYYNTGSAVSYKSLTVIEKVKNKLCQLETKENKQIPKGLLKKLRILLYSLNGRGVNVALCHGDFTSWNCYIKDEKLAIYDWELSSHLMPIGYDAFHYIIQQGILIDRKPWNDIKKDIEKKITSDVLSTWTHQDKNTVDDYLKLYLIINTITSLDLYAKQPNWHIQIYWMLNTWNEAISDCLGENYANRELMILDLFDFLNNKEYAAIKFPNNAPESLNEYSDIDLCIKKSDFKSIKQYLKHHPLVLKVALTRKSYMASFQLFLNDGSVLCIDLLWKVMRKSIAMLNATSVIENSYVNQYGVKQMKLLDMVRYIGLFHGLNNKKIPTKFKAYQQLLTNNECKLDEILYCNYLDNTVRKNHLKKCLYKQKRNKLINIINNTFNYLIDSSKQFFQRKGMTITFSGVDGAGKSTVIEKIKFEIEKKMRRKVVILRHRPSLLPILSVWVKGKEKAHLDVINALPRKGKNKSVISSFFRFAYYLTDFIIGQFYIYVKHLSRGHIVLYDRYYFDLISDSRRSNIDLPKSILKAGYTLLMEPELNFFLFANSKIILKRKQELDSITIGALTTSYLNLFNDLKETSESKYVTIENVNLEETLGKIMQITSQKLYQAS